MMSRLAQSTRTKFTVLGIVISVTMPISSLSSVQAQDILPVRQGDAILPAPRTQRLTLIGAIDLARRNYPAMRTASLRADAARENITQARTAYLPRTDLLLDENYGTANNITGFLAPQNIVPNISGAVNNKNNFLGGFGFTTGALISWQPFDFGLRGAQVDVARSKVKQAQAQVAVSELETLSQTADAYLSVLAAHEVVKAAQAKVGRLKVFLDTVHVLAQQKVKPVTDEYLAQTEFIRASDELIAAQQNDKIALVALAKWTAISPDCIEVDPGPLIKQIPENHFAPVDLHLHPLAIAQQATVNLVHAQKHAIDRSYFPQFFLRVPVYARGSSFNQDLSLNFGKGYYPTKFNYAISALVTFPAMDFFLINSQKRQASKNELAERSRMEEILLNLQQQDAQSRAMIEGALRIAANAPLKVKAAQEAATSTRVRYEYQLATVNDVAQNDQAFTQAQVDYATAQLQVWRAALAASVARGAIKPFVDEVSRAAPEWK